MFKSKCKLCPLLHRSQHVMGSARLLLQGMCFVHGELLMCPCQQVARHGQEVLQGCHGRHIASAVRHQVNAGKCLQFCCEEHGRDGQT